MKSKILTSAIALTAIVSFSTVAGATGDDHGVLTENTTISEDVIGITRTVTDADENGAYKNGDRTHSDAGEYFTLTIANGVKFKNNHAVKEEGVGAHVAAGGAIQNWHGNTLLIGNNVVFEGNSATGTGDDGDLNMGGAIYSEGPGVKNTITAGNGVQFNNNTAQLGGAMNVYGEHDIQFGDNAQFANNTATDGNAGAIFARTAGEGDIDIVFGKNAKFANNTAEYGGGAILNYADAGETASIVFGDGASFIGNSSTDGIGGAIFNGGTMTFGDVVFSGNTDVNGANDIRNLGTINFNGNATLDGGIIGNGVMTVAAGKTLNIGTASIEQGTLTLNGTLIATVREGDAQLNIANTFDGTGSVKLALADAGTYHIFGGKVFGNVDVSSSVYDLTWSGDNKDLTATLKSVEDIAADNGLSADTANAFAGLTTSSSAALKDLSVKMQETLATGDKQSVEHAAKAIHPETESVAQTVALSMQNTVANLASGRLMSIGRNGGDVDVTGGGVWAQGIYNKSKQNGAFNGYTRGVAGGIDMTLNRALMLGAGYSYAHSDISGTARDTEIDSSTIFAYGQYKPTDWFVYAIANYTMSDYSENGIALGTGVSATYDVHSYGAQLMSGYDFAGGITPSVGVRYMHVSADEYKNSLGIKNKLEDSDYMTAILDTKWTYGFKMNKHLMIKPELHYAVKYDFMSDEQTATVTLPGVDSYVLSGDRLSRIGGEFGAGLGVKFRGLDLSVNYDIEIRNEFTSHTGRVKLRYEF